MGIEGFLIGYFYLFSNFLFIRTITEELIYLCESFLDSPYLYDLASSNNKLIQNGLPLVNQVVFVLVPTYLLVSNYFVLYFGSLGFLRIIPRLALIFRKIVSEILHLWHNASLKLDLLLIHGPVPEKLRKFNLFFLVHLLDPIKPVHELSLFWIFKNCRPSRFIIQLTYQCLLGLHIFLLQVWIQQFRIAYPRVYFTNICLKRLFSVFHPIVKENLCLIHSLLFLAILLLLQWN